MSDLDFTMKVLVVDDMSTMRRIVKNVLRQIGYTSVEEAADGKEALEKLKDGRFLRGSFLQLSALRQSRWHDQ